MTVCEITGWPVGFERCAHVHPTDRRRCDLSFGHAGNHRAWERRKDWIDWDNGRNRLEWSTHNDGDDRG